MRRILLVLLALPCHPSSAQDIPPIRGLSRTNLLEYRAKDGTIKTAQTAAEWEPRRKEAQTGFLQIIGPLPGPELRCPLDVQTLDET